MNCLRAFLCSRKSTRGSRVTSRRNSTPLHTVELSSCLQYPGSGDGRETAFWGGFGVDTPIDIRERLGSHARRASIPDATTQDEIDAALAGAPADLLVGARSLAEALARQFAPVGTTPPRPPHRGPVLAVIGSTDPITLGQVRHVRSVCPDLTYIPAPDGIVHVPIALPLPGGALIQATETSERVYPAVVARRLGGVVEALDLSTVTHLVLSGGATAQAVLSQLGIGALDVAGEIFPGLPVARAGTLTIVTKSGGFGEDDIFTRLLGCLLEAPEGDNACPTD